ncbi:MAG: hypothetical protein FWH08_01715 [Oscillospiraceae bacterium]|nr:hypothetical protein [Oscillospiraceae bacterium]
MFIFVIVMLVLVISDMLEMKKNAKKADFTVYFILTAIVLTGAGFYYAYPSAPSIAARLLSRYTNIH